MNAPTLSPRLVEAYRDYYDEGPPELVAEYVVTSGDDEYVFANFEAAKAALKAVSTAARNGLAVFPCSWMVERTDGYEVDFPSDLYVPCGAPSTEDEDGNGWSCFAGHGHRSDLEYFDDDEIASARANGHTLPANAATMAGARLS